MDVRKTLILIGLAPLPIWLIVTTAAGFFATDYSPITFHVSVMTLQDGIAHVMVNAAALASGLALLLFSVGVWLESKRRFSGGAFCWFLFGISMLANGIWPMGGPMHGLYIIGLFNVLAPALSLLDLGSDKSKNLIGVTTFVSLMSVLYLWLLLTGFDPDGYSGLTQRVFGTINLVWPMVMAYQVLKVDGAGR